MGVVGTLRHYSGVCIGFLLLFGSGLEQAGRLPVGAHGGHTGEGTACHVAQHTDLHPVRVIERITADPDQRDLADFLRHTPIEQSRPEGTGPKGTNTPLVHRRPIALKTDEGRVTTLFHEHQRLLDDQPHDQAEHDLLAYGRACPTTTSVARISPVNGSA